MIEFIGNFQNDVGIAGFCKPSDRVHYACSHGLFVSEDLVLSLVVAPENNGGSVMVTRFDDPLHPPQITFPK